MKEIVIIVLAVLAIALIVFMMIRFRKKPMPRDEWFFELIRRNLK